MNMVFYLLLRLLRCGPWGFLGLLRGISGLPNYGHIKGSGIDPEGPLYSLIHVFVI